MGQLRLIWWRFLMDLRPLLRFSAERFPRLSSPGVRIRALAHLAIGNPFHVLVMFYGSAVWAIGESYQLALVAWCAGLALVEISFQLVRLLGGWAPMVWLLGWREAWRVRRRWPADWAIVAAKTIHVQAEVGTSKEPIASARLRPIADHPKMSWWPRVSWPVVSWWVGPPPGRAFDALEDVTSQLAANISHCVDVSVDFAREADSFGRLVVTFADPLQSALEPPAPVDIAAELDALLLPGSDDDGPAEATDDLDEPELPEDGRHLELVESDWETF